jgi:Tol biopolymer transport system component
MALAPGTRLGAYEIVAPLGAGGMGEVYRARDSRLNRDVAIKVLSDAFADDAERVARFEREAQLLAAVNHPHIAAIYGVEGRAIVLELVDGVTLAERLAAGPLSVDDAIPIAMQIAEALEAAHERGVVHRDLKPANIKLTPDGDVKVLDFGLAKLIDAPASGTDTSQSPTFTAQGTFAGVILGTAPYMSPEQARGRTVDKRTDIWAFGCVLFEMLSGKRAFAGDDVTETLGAIIHKEPPWDALPAAVPAHIQTLLRRCLQKNPKDRLRDIGDARIELSTRSVAPLAPAPTVNSRWSWAGWGAAALLAGILAFTSSRTVAVPSAPLVRFPLSSGQAALSGLPPAVSPDGRMVAFLTREAFGRPGIWVRSLEGLEPRRLTNTSNVDGMVFWSPDSRSIAFAAGGVLRKVDVDSGTTTTIGEVPGGPGSYRGGDWNRNGVILIGSRSGLFQMKSGSAVAVSRTVEGDSMHGTPSFLPDGRRFVFLRASQNGNDGFYVGSLDSPPESQLSQRLAIDASGGQLVAEENAKVGYFFFTRQSTLLVQPFDLAQLTPLGEPGIITEGVPATTTFGPRLFSVGGATLAFRGADTFATAELRWFDGGGKDLGRLGNVAGYSAMDISRDGRLAVVEQSHPQSGVLQLWSIDLSRGVVTRVNPGEQADMGPALSVDGRVAFTRVSPGSPGLGDLYRRPANGTGELELLWQSPNLKHANDWSPDGRFLIFDEHHPTQRQDLWVLPMEGERKPQPVLATPADETLAQFSPDGRWILYRSDESGQIEIYLRDFSPGRSPAVGDQKWTISRNGGDRPRWSPDGKAVYYIDLDHKMTRVPLVGSGATLQPGPPEPLFKVNPVGFTPYDLTPDGRFLVSSVASEDGQQSVPMTIVLNWQRLLER